MADSKLKYIALLNLLKEKSSEKEPISSSQICEELSKQNISNYQRNLKRDIAALAGLGYAIKKVKLGHENGYYLECNELDESDVRIVLDALQAAPFITKEKTVEIAKKLLSVTAKTNDAEEASQEQIVFNTKKARNSLASDNIGIIAKAIRLGHRISFKVFDLNEDAEPVYHNDANARTEDPVALVFHKDQYYLLTANYEGSGKEGPFVNYRVDRIDNIVDLEEPISEEATRKKSQVAGYVESMVDMYNGANVEVVFKITSEKLLKYVFEEFGYKDTKIIKMGPSEYIASVKTKASPPFFGWVFQFEPSVEILKPEEVRERYDAIKMVTRE